MTDEQNGESLSGARGRLGEQVSAMEREFQRMQATGEAIPALAQEMLTRLRALASALDGLEATFQPPAPTRDGGTPEVGETPQS